MNRRFLASSLSAAVLFTLALAPFAAQANDKTLLKNMDVTGTLSNGDTFTGTLSVTELGYDSAKGLVATGSVKGVVTDATGNVVSRVNQAFSGVPATLQQGMLAGFGGAATAQQPVLSCSILTLDIGAIHLDLLGLVLDVAPISIDLTAVPGPTNLLGNLLCAIAGLLNPTGFLTDLINGLNVLTSILAAINGIL